MGKTNKFIFVGILVLTLVLSLTSATTSSVFSISNINHPTSVSENSNIFTFSFNLTYNGADESRDFSFANSTTSIGTISIPSITDLNGSINETRKVTGTVTGFQNRGGSSMLVRINASSGTERDDQTTFVVAINEEGVSANAFCEFGEVGSLEIIDFVVTNLGRGDDEEWEPLDRIEIEVEIENTNRDDDVRDVVAEIKIMDGNNDVTNDFDIKDETIDIGRINDDDSEVVTFVIEELPADLEEGRYRIFIKAYKDGDEDLECTSESTDFDNSDNSNLYHEIEYIRSEDVAVIVKNDDLFGNTIQASCGASQVEVTFPIYNIGTDKEDKILVRLTSRELELDESVVVESLRSGKRKDVSFFIDIPKNLDKNRYSLDITTYFDYDKGEDELNILSYDSNSHSDLDESYRMNIEILNCEVSKPSVTAKLDSSAVVGEELIVTTTIKNTADKDVEFLVSVSDFSDWADLLSQEVQTINLDARESKDLTVRFTPTESGTQTFKINSIVEGQTFEQSVTVNVGEGKTSIFEGIDNLTLYLIIGIVLLVILILLTLIIRVARRGKRREFSDLS